MKLTNKSQKNWNFFSILYAEQRMAKYEGLKNFFNRLFHLMLIQSLTLN
jgi:hypothetical protein